MDKVEFSDIFSFLSKEFEAFIVLGNENVLVINSLNDEVFIDDQKTGIKTYFEKDEAQKYLKHAIEQFEETYEDEIEEARLQLDYEMKELRWEELRYGL